MAFNRVTEFTSDHETAARVVERIRRDTRKVLDVYLLHLIPAIWGRSEDSPDTVQSAIDALFAPLPSRGVPELLIGGTEFRRTDDWPGRRLAWDRVVISSRLLKVYAGIEYLRPLGGDLHIVALVNTVRGLPPYVRGVPHGFGVLDPRTKSGLRRAPTMLMSRST